MTNKLWPYSQMLYIGVLTRKNTLAYYLLSVISTISELKDECLRVMIEIDWII
jgi:hypothetical protein